MAVSAEETDSFGASAGNDPCRTVLFHTDVSFLTAVILSLQQRSGETVKVHQLDVAIPLQLKSQLRKGGSGQPCISEGDGDISDTMQFVMLTRKGNKQQVTLNASSRGVRVERSFEPLTLDGKRLICPEEEKFSPFQMVLFCF